MDEPVVFDRYEMSPLVVKRTVPRKSKRRGSSNEIPDPPSISPEEVEADPSRFIPLSDPMSIKGERMAQRFIERHPEAESLRFDAENPEAFGPLLAANDLDEEFYDYMVEFCTREMLDWAKKNGFYFKDDEESLAPFMDLDM